MDKVDKRMNKAKQKGTQGETKVVKYLRSLGIESRRVALAGSNDEGDIHLEDYPITLEIKAGKQTANYNRQKKLEWLAQTKAEARNSKREGYLVIVIHQRAITNAEVWSADGKNFWYLDDWAKEIKKGE